MTPETNTSGRNPNSGHGHVWPRPDGVKARCGGPGLCAECSRDLAQAEQWQKSLGKQAPLASKMRVACATTSHDVEEGECPWCTIERLTRESEAWDKASLVAIIAERDRLREVLVALSKQRPDDDIAALLRRIAGSPDETECGLCAAGINSFTDPDTGVRIHARNGTVTPCSAQKAPETKHAQAPIARIEVAGDGTVKKVKDVSLYAPGLPSGVHDLYCEPESSAPMMLEKRAYYETHDPPHCPTCGCGAPETERPIREDIKVGSTLFRAGVKLRIVLERIERGFTYHAEPSEKASDLPSTNEKEG